jgi:hypothetical protein
MLPEDIISRADVVVLSLQEVCKLNVCNVLCSGRSGKVVNAWTDAAQKRIGPDFSLLKTRRLVGLALIIFVHQGTGCEDVDTS